MKKEETQATARTLWADIEKIRTDAPLVHNITNYVVMNSSANALLALGASPVMAHAKEEVEEMTSIAQALVINIGTLSKHWVESMFLAAETAGRRGIPFVLDPVGAGATKYRTETCLKLLQKVSPAVIRGNASEIRALLSSEAKTKGVDSLSEAEKAVEAAQRLAEKYDCTVSISGKVDYIVDRSRRHRISNGHSLMPRVTGMGCAATALTGAFAAVNQDPFMAAVHAMATMGIAGEIAGQKASGPGSLQMHFLDTLHKLSKKDIEGRLKAENAV